MSRVRKAARSLFGRPDPKMITEQLENTLKKLYEKDKEIWNFDFELGCPVENGSGDYHFTPVMDNEVPDFYRDRPARTKRVAKIPKSGSVSPALSPLKLYMEECRVSKSQLFSLDSPSPSKRVKPEANSYEKPVTRSATRLSFRKETDLNKEDGLKQTKLTNFMRVRKRRSETNLALIEKSASMEFIEKGKNLQSEQGKGIEESEYNKMSSFSDTTLVVSPRSPPNKRLLRSRRTAAGDC